MSNLNQKTSGITIFDKIGYALGDTGCALTLSLVTGYLQVFYTDILGIGLDKIFVLMIVSRFWDGLNDPIWGNIVDSRKPSKHGKFRPYLRWLSIPLAFTAILAFTYIPGLSENQYLVFAYISYLLYDIMYTGVNIPYGSLASVITHDQMERSSLSVFRSIGAGLGGLPAQILLPLFIYSTVGDKKYLNIDNFYPAVIGMALLSIVIFQLSFKMTKERVSHPPMQEKANIWRTIGTLLRNRPFVAICLISMLQIGATMYTQSVTIYLFKDFFERPELLSLFSIFTYLPMVLLLPFLDKMVRRFGKKELCAIGVALSSAANLLAFIFKISDPRIYLMFSFLSGLGITFLTMEVWALVTDVIDYQELLSGRREEGSSYAFYSFARKMGHTVASSGSIMMLNFIGYQVSRGDAIPPEQTAETARGLYNIATLVPAIMYILIFLLLAFLYPLGKKELKDVSEKLSARREKAASK